MPLKFWQVLRWPPRRLVLWHTIAATPMAMVVVLGAYLSYHDHQLAQENRVRVDRAYEVLDVVDGLYISVQDANVAQRDFVITGDPAHLAAFQSALRIESEDSGRLRGLLNGSSTPRCRPGCPSWGARSPCASNRASTPRATRSSAATAARRWTTSGAR